MSDRVRYSLSQGVASITMDDGKVNAMSVAMLADLREAFEQAARDEAIAVLRSGRNGTFSAGFDLKVFASGDAQRSLEMVKAGAQLALLLLEHPRPIIGVLEGHAYPMGAFLLLACDVRLGITGSHRIGLNEVAIGIAPPSFAIELARSRVQPAWLSRTVTMGEMFAPDDAVTAGFLDQVVDATELEATIAHMLVALKAIHPASHALAKRRLRKGTVAAMRAAIADELTLAAYQASAAARTAVELPTASAGRSVAG